MPLQKKSKHTPCRENRRKIDDSTNDNKIAPRIFYRKYKVYSSKKFSWIYMYSTSVDVYNTNKSEYEYTKR